MTKWRMMVLGALGSVGGALLVAGCQEPTEIVPAAPPGTSYVRLPPPEKEEPQAKGESVAQAPLDSSKKQPVAGTISPPTAVGETKSTPSGVTYETLKAGDGPEVKPGQTVLVHYTGTLADGTVFDDSRKRDEPASMELSNSGLIAGWIEGVPGMKVGERRKLTIPPALAYGESGRPPTIPASATLVFEIDLIGIK
jgi:FKBP-type peptidyl-prolyl cis-trans isomerase